MTKAQKIDLVTRYINGETPEELAKICINLLYDETKRKAMSKALESAVSGNAANIICEIMCEEV